MNALEIIETLVEDGATDRQSMLDALCDGEYLAQSGITDEDAVGEAFHMIGDSDIDEHLANGGTIGNYQW